MWVHGERAPRRGGLYISASDGKTRSLPRAGPGRGQSRATLGEELVGHVRAKNWRRNRPEIMLAMTGSQRIWVDGARLLATTVPDPLNLNLPEVDGGCEAGPTKRPIGAVASEHGAMHQAGAAFASILRGDGGARGPTRCRVHTPNSSLLHLHAINADAKPLRHRSSLPRQTNDLALAQSHACSTAFTR